MKKYENGSAIVMIVVALAFTIIIITAALGMSLTSAQRTVNHNMEQQAYISARSVAETIAEAIVEYETNTGVKIVEQLSKSATGRLELENLEIPAQFGAVSGYLTSQKDKDGNVVKIQVTATATVGKYTKTVNVMLNGSGYAVNKRGFDYLPANLQEVFNKGDYYELKPGNIEGLNNFDNTHKGLYVPRDKNDKINKTCEVATTKDGYVYIYIPEDYEFEISSIEQAFWMTNGHYDYKVKVIIICENGSSINLNSSEGDKLTNVNAYIYTFGDVKLTRSKREATIHGAVVINGVVQTSEYVGTNGDIELKSADSLPFEVTQSTEEEKIVWDIVKYE